jgi:serine phosphatase RsbU (regulator of sigma subunit)
MMGRLRNMLRGMVVDPRSHPATRGHPLLGIPYEAAWTSARHPLPLGSTLLLYTDGLVERPGEHLDKGFDRLRERAAAQCRVPLDRLCDDLLSFLPRHADDDVAMIGLRSSPSTADHVTRSR